MVTHTLNLCSAFTHPKCTHTHTHTHTVNTHTEQWAAILARAPGEQLGVRGLAQGYLSRGIECGKPRLPLICVPKRNEGLAGLERHKGE